MRAEEYKKIASGVRSVCRTLNKADVDIDDITQDVAITLWKAGILKVSYGLIKQITVNRTIDLWRRGQIRPEPPVIFIREDTEDYNLVGEEILAAESKARVLALLSELKPQYREVLYLFLFENYDLGEIAEKLAVSYDAARMRKYRGLQDIKKLLVLEGVTL